MAAITLDTKCCLDYLSIIHWHVYHMSINQGHISMFKKYLRLIDDELDANLGVPPPLTPARPQESLEKNRKRDTWCDIKLDVAEIHTGIHLSGVKQVDAADVWHATAADCTLHPCNCESGRRALH